MGKINGWFREFLRFAIYDSGFNINIRINKFGYDIKGKGFIQIYKLIFIKYNIYIY